MEDGKIIDLFFECSEEAIVKLDSGIPICFLQSLRRQQSIINEKSIQ